MLKRVSEVLEQLELMPPGSQLAFNVNITSGESLAISAFVSPQRFFQIKASEFMDLRDQYDAYCRGWQRFGTFVPRPLGYRSIDGWSIMVTEGVDHSPAHGSDFRRKRRGGTTLKDQALAFFAAGAKPAPAGTGQAALFDTLERHFAATPFAAEAAHCLRHARALGAADLVGLPQHGDFVINNLAFSGRRFVVFDWEDFDKLQLPGLDIFTMLLSLLSEDATALRAVMASTSADPDIDGFVQQACALQGLGEKTFRRLIPLYVLAFFYLKRNYGASIQQRMGQLLVRLAEALPVTPSRAAPPMTGRRAEREYR